MDADLKLYRDQVRRFIAAEIVPRQAAWREQRHVDRAVWRHAGEMGFLLADIPEAYGGAGGSYAHMAVLWEELVQADEAGFGSHVHALAAHHIHRHGTEAQKQRYLPRLASGEWIAAIAMTEPAAGSDLQNIAATAVRNGDGYRVNGSKSFVSNGRLADLVLLAAKTDPAANQGGISLLLVETQNLAGFQRGPILEMIGRRGQDACELFFDEVSIPSEAVLGGVEGKGMSQIAKAMPYERTLLGIVAVAAIERAVELTADHARERKLFGKSLFDLQNTRFKLAEARTRAVIGRVFIDWCIEKMIAGDMEADIAAMAKWYLTDMQCAVIDECLQLFGGYGYCREYPIAQMHADARVQKIYGGANEVMKEIIAYSM